jgi:hypothetical protein
VSYLVSSHERLDSAELSCAFPCTCDMQRLSAYSSDNNAYQTTLTRMVRLPFQTGGQLHGAEVGCELRVRALERGGHDASMDTPGKGSNGFKLMGLGATVYSFI